MTRPAQVSLYPFLIRPFAVRPAEREADRLVLQRFFRQRLFRAFLRAMIKPHKIIFLKNNSPDITSPGSLFVIATMNELPAGMINFLRKG